MRLSVIIPNYNYADYVGFAIESALSIEWPDVEIIVVDDGSTDRSRSIIESFKEKASIIMQENSTQRVACNVGFANSTGDIIIFLDSDDLLHPAIAKEIDAVWRDGTSKIQFQMARIDANGRRTGSVFPPFRPMPTPDLIRHWSLTTTAYPTPPGSGNAYTRTFLDRIFPLDDSCGNAPDSACIAAAPLLGDVITVQKPLVFYRVHDRNDSNLSARDFGFAREVARAQARLKFAARVGETVGVSISDSNLFKSLHLLQFRVPSLRLTPTQHPLLGDSRRRAVIDTFRAAWSYSQMDISSRLIVCLWALITLLAPKAIAKKLIDFRFRRG